MFDGVQNSPYVHYVFVFIYCSARCGIVFIYCWIVFIYCLTRCGIVFIYFHCITVHCLLNCSFSCNFNSTSSRASVNTDPKLHPIHSMPDEQFFHTNVTRGGGTLYRGHTGIS